MGTLSRAMLERLFWASGGDCRGYRRPLCSCYRSPAARALERAFRTALDGLTPGKDR